jgi:hypothetical protein
MVHLLVISIVHGWLVRTLRRSSDERRLARAGEAPMDLAKLYAQLSDQQHSIALVKGALTAPPIEQATKFELLVNLDPQQIGLTIPPNG